MNYPLENAKPSFCLGDFVEINTTGTMAVITEVNCNQSQTQDIHQWTYSLLPLYSNSQDHYAWYDRTELKLRFSPIDAMIKKNIVVINNLRKDFTKR